MQKIDLRDIARVDFNLAVTFLAIWQERSVSRAAQRLSLSQSAVSSALTRLREVAGDPLFVRSQGIMQPTPRAERMASEIEVGTALLREAFLARPTFDPATSERRFNLGMSDDFQLAFGPEIARRLSVDAPGVTIGFRQSNRQFAGAMVESGEIDMAIVASWPKRSVLAHEQIAEGCYACLFDPVACGLTGALTLDAYLTLPHVLVSFSGREGIVDEALKAKGLTRRVQTALTHFSALPAFLAGRRAVATLPAHAAIQIARHSSLEIGHTPVDLGLYAVSMIWRPNLDGDTANVWMRTIVRQVIREMLPAK
ncbi:LysR family transcriptional activator of mexEF-oprN operon [Agrobacterium pusense]|uniref:LysR family transcriptional regulator n=1 Tax=Agrobacterium pusense TaxID=648995 RepID=UPI002854D4DB|nr:LysR family transcriptional regulator [Agrobacterium pusense]MDR6192916.1 LysR family transcriptional activator of mexEF-oprN operon [Agrobacterium pusense]